MRQERGHTVGTGTESGGTEKQGVRIKRVGNYEQERKRGLKKKSQAIKGQNMGRFQTKGKSLVF